jgi:hypothetical protein
MVFCSKHFPLAVTLTARALANPVRSFKRKQRLFAEYRIKRRHCALEVLWQLLGGDSHQRLGQNPATSNLLA